MTEPFEGVCEALDVACAIIKEEETHRRGKLLSLHKTIAKFSNQIALTRPVYKLLSV